MGGKSVTRPCGGFTLLELLVVMVIIGLLAGFVAPKYFAQVGKSQVRTAEAQIQGLASLISKPGNEAKWNGPYLERAVPVDPWDRPYAYKSPGEHGDYDHLSYGKDGQPGGAGEASDITSW